MMYDYTIAKTADAKVYAAQVKKIKAENTGIIDSRRLTDVDESDIYIFRCKGGEIKIHFDTEVDAVYVLSTMPVDHLLVNKPLYFEVN